MPAAKPQRFTASYARNSPFTSKGLRTFWEYRDLGVEEATWGRYRAQVLRAMRPCPPEGTGWHYHELDFQMYYVLKGSMTTRVEGEGEFTFHAGDSFVQPPGTRHNVVHFSDDLEMLEVISPADLRTIEVDLEE